MIIGAAAISTRGRAGVTPPPPSVNYDMFGFGTAATVKTVTFSDDTIYDLGADDFVISFWMHWSGSQENGFALGKWGSSGQRSFYVQINTGLLRFGYSTNGSTETQINAGSISWDSNTLYNITLARVGTDFDFYIDGVLHDTGSISGTLFTSTTNFYIGGIAFYPSSLLMSGSLTNVFLGKDVSTAWELADSEVMYNNGEIPYTETIESNGSSTYDKLSFGVELSGRDDTAEDLIGTNDGTKNGSVAADGENETYGPYLG